MLGSRRKIIVTGSARLDYYRKGGDSLAGRYRYFRLHPFSLRELNRTPSRSDLQALLKFGGFPEPLFSQNAAEHRIWRRDRISRVVREDLRDLEHVREISLVEHLADMLPSKVGSPLSVKSLREDLQVDHKTAERWLQILENMVASQLLKYCHWVEDTQGYAMELRYLRDTDKREVDFVVLKNHKPLFAVECNSGDKAIGPALRYFAERTPIPRFYQTHLGERHFSTGKVTVIPFIKLCEELGLP